MDTFYYLSFAVISAGIVGSVFLGYKTFTENRKREDALKEEILQLLAKQNASNLNADKNRIDIEALRKEFTEIAKTKTDGNHLMPLLSSLAERLDSQSSNSSSGISGHVKTSTDDDHSVYNHAIRLAKENQTAEKIVEICGIEPSEAELIVRMHGAGTDQI
jgi:hypothetical protein